MQGRLLFADDVQRARAQRMGITDFDCIYTESMMARGDVMFAATGVTRGMLLDGVRPCPGGAITESLVMRAKTGTVRYIKALHNFARKPSVTPA
jgi:fructose-1,6-bisphosphatase II / sedoheptulose-1,7-bisphosphatase